MDEENSAVDSGKSNSLSENEKLNQRREARRRNILNNAKTRLEKLGGRIDQREERHNTFFEYPDPEVEPNEIKFNNFNHRSMYTAPGTAAAADGTPEDTYDPFADDEPPKEYIAFKYRLHVLLSITVTYILTLLGLFGDSTYFSVFVPTGICVALELLIKPTRQINPLIALAVSLCKISPQYATIAWSTLSIAYDLIIDLGLSVFSIVSLTLLYNYFSGNTIATLQ